MLQRNMASYVVGATTSFIRCEDQSVIASIIGDKKLEGWALERLHLK
jgi:hypothetical protein